MTKTKYSKGFTLIELLVSILVSSIVITMLVQMVTMSIAVRNEVQVESRLKDESYFLAEQISFNIFKLQTQSVERTETANTITIIFNHDYGVNIDSSTGVISYVPSTVPSDILIYYKDNGQANAGELHYNGLLIHSNNVFFEAGTDLTVTPVNSICDPSSEACSDVVLTLTFVVTIELDNGARIDNMTFETTIVI